MDVIEIAKQRRSNLQRELSKLDEFIRVGEELRKHAGNGSGEGAGEAAGKDAMVKPIREFSSENAASRS